MQDLIVVTRRALVIRIHLVVFLFTVHCITSPAPEIHHPQAYAYTPSAIRTTAQPPTTHSTTDSQLGTAAATFAFTAFNRASREKKNSTIRLAIQSLACPYNIFPHTPYRPFPKQTWSNPISSPSSPFSPFPSLPSLPSLPSIIPIRTMASRPNQSIMPLLARQ